MRYAKATLWAADAAFTAEAAAQAAGARFSEALTSEATSARAEAVALGRLRTRVPLCSAAPRRIRLGWRFPKRPMWPLRGQ